MLDAIRRYQGGVKSRRTDGFNATNASANAEIERDLPTLRARSRDLVRNNPHAAKAISTFVANAVGEGIRPRSNTGDPALDKMANDLFEAWSVDASGDTGLDFFGLQALAFRGMLESGDSLTRRRGRRMSDGLPVPLQLQIMEGDLLDRAKTVTLDNGRMVIQGVEFDEAGRLNAYWLFRQHPGNNFTTGRDSFGASRPVTAQDVAHLFEAQRPGQVRGVPHLSPIINALRDLDDYRDAERFRKKLEACIVAFVMSDDEVEGGLGPEVTDADGEILEELQPGLIARVRGGKDVRMSTPATVGGYGEYHRTELQAMGAGARMTYELISGDLSQVNFSSIRAGLLEFRRVIRMMQRHLIIPLWCRPVWRWFIEAAIASGALPDREGGWPAKWIPPAFESIDRVKDAEADILEIRGGLTSQQDAIARRGGDPRAQMDEMDQWNAEVDAKGIILDTDPRNVARSGRTHETPE